MHVDLFIVSMWLCLFAIVNYSQNIGLTFPVTSKYICIGVQFLPRCMECRRSLAIKILSVCLTVCPSGGQTRAL